MNTQKEGAGRDAALDVWELMQAQRQVMTNTSGTAHPATQQGTELVGGKNSWPTPAVETDIGQGKVRSSAVTTQYMPMELDATKKLMAKEAAEKRSQPMASQPERQARDDMSGEPGIASGAQGPRTRQTGILE